MIKVLITTKSSLGGFNTTEHKFKTKEDYYKWLENSFKNESEEKITGTEMLNDSSSNN